MFSVGIWWKGRKILSVSHTLMTPETWKRPYLCFSYMHTEQEGDSERNSEVLSQVQSPSDHRGEAGSFHVTSWELWIRRGAEGISSLLSPSTMPEHVSHRGTGYRFCKQITWTDRHSACELQKRCFNECLGRWWSHTHPGFISGGLGKGFWKPFFPTSQYVSSTPLP